MAAKRSQVIEFIRSHPLWYARMTFRRFIFTWTGFWSLYRDYLAQEPGDPWNILMSTILLALMLIGFRHALQERIAVVSLFASAMIVFPLVYYISFTQMSYRHPIDPLLAIMAAYGAVGCFPGWRNEKPMTDGRP
jgi:hypothetical protein